MKLFVNSFVDPTIRGLEKAMDLQFRRNEAIASNIANAETPQYRASELNFAGELDRAFNKNTGNIKMTNQKHMDLSANSGAHLEEDYSGATKPDGNNVDIDIQMGRLALTSGKYAGAARMLRKKLGMLKFAIRDAGR